jgi:hypothetical protein
MFRHLSTNSTSAMFWLYFVFLSLSAVVAGSPVWTFEPPGPCNPKDGTPGNVKLCTELNWGGTCETHGPNQCINTEGKNMKSVGPGMCILPR